MTLPPRPDLDPTTSAWLLAYRRQLFEHRVRKVNSTMGEFRRVWPDGRPVDFFIAADLCDNDVPTALQKLDDDSFVRLVQAEAVTRRVRPDRPKHPRPLSRMPWEEAQKMRVEARFEP
jgi:hypothetical protein